MGAKGAVRLAPMDFPVTVRSSVSPRAANCSEMKNQDFFFSFNEVIKR